MCPFEYRIAVECFTHIHYVSKVTLVREAAKRGNRIIDCQRLWAAPNPLPFGRYTDSSACWMEMSVTSKRNSAFRLGWAEILLCQYGQWVSALPPRDVSTAVYCTHVFSFTRPHNESATEPPPLSTKLHNITVDVSYRISPESVSKCRKSA
jgi:hypothetical protein